MERMGSSFSQLVWTNLSVVRWQKSTKTLKGHRNDSLAILDLTLTSLRFDAGLLRIIPTELYHVLIMLTRGRAQRLVLKAADPEGRYERVSTVTTVSELVDLLATTLSDDLMDSLTDFERRVASWEHDAKEFDQHRSRHQRFGERWFWRYTFFLSPTSRTTFFFFVTGFRRRMTPNWRLDQNHEYPRDPHRDHKRTRRRTFTWAQEQEYTSSKGLGVSSSGGSSPRSYSAARPALPSAIAGSRALSGRSLSVASSSGDVRHGLFSVPKKCTVP